MYSFFWWTGVIYIYIFMLPPPEKSTPLSIYIYMLAPTKKNLCFDIAARETRQTQPKHVRAILSVEKKSSDGLWSIYWHGQELYLSRDG